MEQLTDGSDNILGGNTPDYTCRMADEKRKREEEIAECMQKGLTREQSERYMILEAIPQKKKTEQEIYENAFLHAMVSGLGEKLSKRWAELCVKHHKFFSDLIDVEMHEIHILTKIIVYGREEGIDVAKKYLNTRSNESNKGIDEYCELLLIVPEDRTAQQSDRIKELYRKIFLNSKK